MDYEVRVIECSDVIRKYISQKHYSQTCPVGIKHCFGLFENTEMIGVCLFGNFTRNQAREKYKGCLELVRLFIEDVTPKNTESYFIGQCLRWLKKNTKLDGIISYADPTMGHHGTIYKATNFQHIGFTGKSYHYVDKDDNRVHKRQVWERARNNSIAEKQQALDEGLRIVSEQPKYIYFYPLKKNSDFNDINSKSIFETNQYRLDFFKEWTPESAWIYGIILGDGHVSYDEEKSDYGIRLGCCKDVVYKFEKLLKIQHKNSYKDGIYHTYINNKDLSYWFYKRGVFGKKAYTIEWPKDMPDELGWHFLRGFIDADGSFPFDDPRKTNRKGKKKVSIKISSCSYDFLEGCNEFIKRTVGKELNLIRGNGKIKKDLGVPDSTNTLYSSKLDLVIEIGLQLYDCPENIRNNNKYQAFKLGLDLHNRYQEECIICGNKLHTEFLCSKCMWDKKLKDKLVKYCFCGRPVKVEKYDLCVIHYNRFVNRKKRGSVDLLDFIKNSSHNLRKEKIEVENIIYDTALSKIIIHREHKFLIDKEDEPYFINNIWRIQKGRTPFLYVNNKRILLVREIMGCSDDSVFEYRNGNRFDLRKSNIIVRR